MSANGNELDFLRPQGVSAKLQPARRFTLPCGWAEVHTKCPVAPGWGWDRVSGGWASTGCRSLTCPSCTPLEMFYGALALSRAVPTHLITIESLARGSGRMWSR
jgi:hypothetical protein